MATTLFVYYGGFDMRYDGMIGRLAMLSRRCVALVLTVAILIGLLPMTIFAATVVASGTCGDNLTWEFDESGTLTISGTGDMYDYKENRPPWSSSETAVRHQTKSVVIMPGVTSIGACAFYEFRSMTSVTIPDSMVSIGEQAFYFCDNLQSLAIPDSVTDIGRMAFWECSSITSLKLSKNMKHIAPDTFYNCSSLKTLVIPDGVISIGDAAFRKCKSLTAIFIPDSVTSIGRSAFTMCESLWHVFYQGTTESRSKISLGGWTNNGEFTDYVGEYFLDVTWHYNCTGNEIADAENKVCVICNPSVPEPTEPKPTEPVAADERTFDIQYDFSTTTVDGMGRWEVTYKDSYFERSAMAHYSHDLAQLSLGMAMSAVTVGNGDAGDEQYIMEFLKNIGCKEKTIRHEKFDNNTATDDTCAFAYGLTYLEASDTYLIPVAIRGFGYGIGFSGEWVSNFNVVEKGYGEYAAGFKKAADHVYDSLTTYIKKLESAGISKRKIKVWVSGFSRAAAISNLLGARMNEKSGIDRSNIFVYTFATPATVKKDSAVMYNNIFNVVSEIDIVPRVPLSSWGYSRYGVTYYLPCHSNSGSAYNGYVKKVSEEFKKLMAESNVSTVLYDYENRQELAIDLLIDYIDDVIKTSKQYKDGGYQKLLMDILAGNGGLDYAINMIFEGHDAAANMLMRLLREWDNLSNTDRTLLLVDLIEELRDIVASESDDHPAKGIMVMLLEILVRYEARIVSDIVWDKDRTIVYDTLLTLILDIVENSKDSTLLKQHWPESYLAWLRCGTSVLKAGTYKKISVKCPVDVVVYDESDAIVGRVIDDVVDQSIENCVCIAVDEYGEKNIYLNEDVIYRIEIIAREAGELDIVVATFDGDRTCTGTDCYIDLLMTTGQVFDVKTQDDIVSTGNTVLEPDVRSADGTQRIEITLISKLPGIMFGQGVYPLGESVPLIAADTEEYGFDGWYLNGELLSAEHSYTFSAIQDVEIEARFHAHNWGDPQISAAASCVAEGEMTCSCSVCSAQRTEVYADADAHSDNNRDGLCDLCGASLVTSTPTAPTEEPLVSNEQPKTSMINSLIPVFAAIGVVAMVVLLLIKKRVRNK
jgi:hypothetical protein